MAGEVIALSVINKIDNELKFFHRKTDFRLLP